jgi:hypothetical protein
MKPHTRLRARVAAKVARKRVRLGSAEKAIHLQIAMQNAVSLVMI